MPEKYFSRKFLILFLVIFVMMYVVTYIAAEQSYMYASVTPEGSAQANDTLQNIEAERLTLDAGGIFVNNLRVSWSLILPLVGVVYFLIVLINTGRVIGFLAAAVQIPPSAYILAISLPVGLIEFGAYALLATETTYIVILALTRSGITKERLVKHSWKSLLLYFGLLLLGAVIEAILIG